MPSPALGQKVRGRAPAAAPPSQGRADAGLARDGAPKAMPGATDSAVAGTGEKGEKGVEGARKVPPGGPVGVAPVVATEEGKEGVKTYKFGAVEVEGRLRSPQLIYFLRRVRAEFRAGDLGHRSFLPELSDTARKSTFR